MHAAYVKVEVMGNESKALIEMTERYAAHNYAPLDVVLRSGDGAWVTDVDGNRYLDMLGAYSAMNFGHCNQRIAKAAHAQLDVLTLVSRAFFAEEFAHLSHELAKFCRKDKVLVMNSGAEAVETAIKCARKWGHDVKGVADGSAHIIGFEDNFHGRTTTIVGFSSAAGSRKGFGPFTGGFQLVSYGDPAAIEAAITPNTVAVLIEPILGEGGVVVPPVGFLKSVREICSRHNVLMIADEIQTGLCRTGAIFACDHEGVSPDVILLGKSLGGGITPISVMAADDSVMSVFTPGTHGSTFGGNSFACAIAREVLRLIEEEKPHERAAQLGAYLLERLKALNLPSIREIRCKGLMFGVELKPEVGSAKDVCKRLKYEGILCKDTKDHTIRLAPPLVISKDEIDWALERFARILG